MCHYNLHKSFSSPHGCQGPAAGAQCVCEKLAKFVAAPTVELTEKNIIWITIVQIALES